MGSPTGELRIDFMHAESNDVPSDIISPEEVVRNYWRWELMPETMRRLA
jgi:hypothetical protein